VSFELQIGDGWTGLTLQWHNELPDEWPPELRPVVQEPNDMESHHAALASEQSGQPEPPMTRVLKSLFSGGGPVTAAVRHEC
jgi:hypothetical protein